MNAEKGTVQRRDELIAELEKLKHAIDIAEEPQLSTLLTEYAVLLDELDTYYNDEPNA